MPQGLVAPEVGQFLLGRTESGGVSSMLMKDLRDMCGRVG